MPEEHIIQQISFLTGQGREGEGVKYFAEDAEDFSH